MMNSQKYNPTHFNSDCALAGNEATAPKPTQIHAAMAHLIDTIERTSDVTRELRGRIVPVLRVEPTEDPKPSIRPDNVAPLATAIDELAGKLENVKNDLADILHRLEL